MKERIYKLCICVALTLILPFYILIMPVYAFGPSETELYAGIDVSGWQGTIDYTQVKQAGIEVVYMKASEGTTFIDPYFNQNYTNAKANGLKVGFYHYVRARSVEQAITEANFFASVIAGKSPDCRLAMDFENFGNLSNEEINQIGLAFLRTLESVTKKEVVVYSNTYSARTKFSGEITNYPLWVAQYEEPEPTPNGNWDTWIGWQYTDQGDVAGIQGYVDRDKFTKDIFLGDNSEIPAPQPTPDPPTPPVTEGTTTIIIQRGDTLSGLALRYHTTVSKLVELNQIANPNLIYAGNTLIVPTSSSGSGNANGGDNTCSDEVYIVRSGDTLSGIAAQYHTTVTALANLNHISNVNLIYTGQRLFIPTNRYDMSHTLYQVRWGDTLWGISRRYGVSIATIVRLNRIANPNLIYAGSILRI